MNTLDVCNACLVAIHYGDTSWAYPYEDETLDQIMSRVEGLGAPYIDLPGDDDSPSLYRCAICDQMTDTYEVSLDD